MDTHDFPSIILTKHELKILKSLNKRGELIINDIDFDDLYHYGLIRHVMTGTDEYGDMKNTGASRIKDKGARFLIYVKQSKDRRKIEWIRYIITTCIALSALVISLINLIC